MSVKKPNNKITKINDVADNAVHPKYTNTSNTTTTVREIAITGSIRPLNMPSTMYPLAMPPKHPGNGKNGNQVSYH